MPGDSAVPVANQDDRAVLACLAAVSLVAGCGRLRFDDPERVDDASGTDSVPARRCAGTTQAPNPVHLAGQAVRYTDFVGGFTPVESVMISAESEGVNSGSTVSSANGDYDLSVATGGTPIAVVQRYGRVGYFTTYLYSDLLVDHDVSGELAQVIVGSAMDSVYQAGSVARSQSAGTLVVHVIDCKGATIEGVTIEVSPTPERIEYTKPDGYLDAGQTRAPFGNAIGYNAQPGTNHVVVRRGSVVALEQDVTVYSGDNQTVFVVHPVD